MPRHRKKDPSKACEFCGAPLVRKTYGRRLEDRGVFLRRRFCSLSCSGQASRVQLPTLSTLRGRAQKAIALKPCCEECGRSKDLGRHHKDEDLTNNDPKNVQTLCAGCHTRLHWRTGKKPIPRRVTSCSVCGSGFRPWEHGKRGMCSKHYQRWRVANLGLR